MNKERILIVLCVLLAIATATATAWNQRLRQANRNLQAELAERTAAAPPITVVKPAADTELQPKPRPAVVRNDTSRDRQKELEAENSELRLLLAEQEKATDAVDAKPVPDEEARSFRGRRGRDEEMAELKATDPERYAEIEKQRTEFRERIKTAANDQISFLESVDTARWPAEHQENHARLLALIASVTESFEQGPQADAEGQGESRRRNFEAMREAGELLEAEQTILLYDTARQMGLDENGSKEFVDYIQTVQRLTSPRGFFMGGGRGRPGR